MTILMGLCVRCNNITPELIREFKDSFGMRDKKGKTALMYLCEWNKNITPKLIRELKNEIKMKDKDGKTAYNYYKNNNRYNYKIIRMLQIKNFNKN